MRWDQHGWDHYGHGATCTTSRWAPTRAATSSRPTGRPTARRRATSTRRSGCSARPTLAGDPRASGGIAPTDSRGLREGWTTTTAGAREDAAALRRRVQVQLPAGSERAAAVLRQRADRRRARACDEHGPDRVPPAEHRRRRPSPAHAGWRCWTAATQAAGWKPKVAALGAADRQRPHRPRLRLRPVRGQQVGIVADVEVNVKTRQDRRQAPVHRPEQRDHDRPAAGREPDERRGDPGPLAGAVGAGSRSTRSGSRAWTGSATRSCASRTPEGDARQRAPGRVRHGQPRPRRRRPRHQREQGQHRRVRRRLDR